MANLSFSKSISDDEYAGLSHENKIEVATSMKMAANEFIVANLACYATTHGTLGDSTPLDVTRHPVNRQ